MAGGRQKRSEGAPTSGIPATSLTSTELLTPVGAPDVESVQAVLSGARLRDLRHLLSSKFLDISGGKGRLVRRLANQLRGRLRKLGRDELRTACRRRALDASNRATADVQTSLQAARLDPQETVRSRRRLSTQIHYDKHAVLPGPPYSSMHPNCVVADSIEAFVSSTDVTELAQDRNVVVDVLIEDASFFASQWLGLETGMLREFGRHEGRGA